MEKTSRSIPNQQGTDSPVQDTTLPDPQGIGMAVAFDWGIAVQLLVTPFLMGNNGIFKSMKWNPMLATFVTLLITLPFAAVLVIFGEGIRRGWQWARPLQVGANAIGFLGGLLVLYTSWRGIQRGNYWSLVTIVILLIFSPLIAWRMSRPATVKWFANVTSNEARKRHGGRWIWLIALWSIIGGVLQALAVFSK